MTTSSVNTSSLYLHPLPTTVTIGVMTSLLAMATTVFNGITFMAFFLSGSLRQFGDYFILNLAVADFAIGVLSIPPYIPYTLTGRWTPGKAYCLVWLLWDYVTPAASTFCMCVISLDRYLLVAHPMWYRQHQSSRLLTLMLLTPWVIPTLVYMPAILLWEAVAGEATIADEQCYVPYAHSISFLIFGSFIEFLLPFAVMAVVNLLIFVNIRRRARRRVGGMRPARNNTKNNTAPTNVFSTRVVPVETVPSAAMEETSMVPPEPPSRATAAEPSTSEQDGSSDPQRPVVKTEAFQHPKSATLGHRTTTTTNNNTNSNSANFKRDRKAARSLFILVLVFALCWLPYEVLALVSAVCRTCIQPVLFDVSFWLLWANSTVNPILYPLLHRRFRDAFFNVLRRVSRCLRPRV